MLRWSREINVSAESPASACATPDVRLDDSVACWQVRHALGFRKGCQPGHAFARAQVDHLERARGERCNEQEVALEIDVQMVDAPGHGWKVDRLGKNQRLRRRRRGTEQDDRDNRQRLDQRFDASTTHVLYSTFMYYSVHGL